MNLKINEDLLNKINTRKKYPNLMIKRKEIKIRNKDVIADSTDISPSAFSFSLEQKNIKLIKSINKKDLINSYFNKKILDSKYVKKQQNLYNRRNNENIKNKFFNKGTSMNESLESSINKEKKNNTLIKSFNKTKDNNYLIIHKKIFFLNNKKPYENPKKLDIKSTQRKNKKTLLVNSASAKRYQTIFTKCITKEIKFKDKSQDPGHNFEHLSSKYNINNLEESKETQTPRKMFSNEELKKTELNNNHNNTMNENYLKTDSTVNHNHTCSVLLPKFVHIPNLENLKNFKQNNKPTFYIQKNDVKEKINLIMQNNKNNYEKNMFLNSNDVFKNKNKNNDRKPFVNKKFNKNKLKTNGIKFVSVNLNGLAKIPNRIVKIDRYGNQIKNLINKNNRKSLFSQSDAFQLIKKNMINRFILIKNKHNNY